MIQTVIQTDRVKSPLEIEGTTPEVWTNMAAGAAHPLSRLIPGVW